MYSNYLGEFLALATIHFLAVVAPGPDFAVTIRQSVRFGRLVGICTALGIGAGISVHVLYTLLGVGALMHTTPWLLTVAKVIGGAYILYLGVSLLRSKPKSAIEGEKTSEEPVVEQTQPEISTPSLNGKENHTCLLYTSPSPRDGLLSRMPSSA